MAWGAAGACRCLARAGRPLGLQGWQCTHVPQHRDSRVGASGWGKVQRHGWEAGPLSAAGVWWPLTQALWAPDGPGHGLAVLERTSPGQRSWEEPRVLKIMDPLHVDTQQVTEQEGARPQSNGRGVPHPAGGLLAGWGAGKTTGEDRGPCNSDAGGKEGSSRMSRMRGQARLEG